MPSRLHILWEVFLLILVFLAGMLAPMVLAVGAAGFSAAFALLTALFGMDFLYTLRTPPQPLHSRPPLGANARGRRRTLRSLIDLLAFLSMTAATIFVLTAAGPAPTIVILVSLLPLTKLYKLDALFDDLQDEIKTNPSILRLGIFVFWIFLGAHLIALGWILIGAVDPALEARLQYVTALYWAVTTLTTVGYGDITPDPTRASQMFFTMLVMLLGVGMYGYIIGGVANLITNLDAARAGYLDKMEEVNRFLKSRGVPENLQERVRSYYRYLWETHKSTTTGTFLNELPHTLEVDLALFLNQNILEKVPYFSDADDLFIREIVRCMEPMVFLPGDYIIRQGEYGEAMYFLSSGEVEVLIDDRIITTRGDGAFFGETSLIRNERRNASIRTATYCDVYRLSKHDFDDLRSRYPEFDGHIREILLERELRMGE